MRHIVPQRRQYHAQTDQVDPYGGQIERQVARHAVQTCGVGCDDRPVFDGLLTYHASGQGDGGGRARIQMGFGVFGYKERGEEADHARLLYIFEGGVGKRHGGKFIPGGEDNVVEAVAALGINLLDVGLHGGGGEVAGVAGYATLADG